MNNHTINVVEDFDQRPYGRYVTESDSSGEFFRDGYLAPALKKYDSVIVNLTGYNRYGRSFIDEAFGGLVRECGWSENDLKNKLVILHDDVESIVKLSWERVGAAQREMDGL